jgi:hypothetical protein
MSEVLVSMPTSMADWFEQCMDGAGQKYHILPLQHPSDQYKLFVVKNMTIEEIHLLLKTYIQTRVNAHEIQVSL